jgi:hypothetical protein
MIINVFHHNLRDFSPHALSIDDVFHYYNAAAGLHTVDTYNRLEITGDMLELDSGLSRTNMRFQHDGTAYRRAVVSGFSLPLSSSIRGNVNKPGWFVTLYERSGGGYAAGVDANGRPSIWLFNGSSFTLLSTTPWVSFTSTQRFEITCRRWQSDSQGAIGRLSICLFINNVLAAAYEEEVDIQTVNSSLGFGLTPWQSTPVTFSDLRVPDFCEVMDVISIDPGEAPANGLGRAIEGVYLKMFMRPSGHMRAYRPFLYSNDSVYTFPMDDLEDFYGPTVDVRGLRSHLRQQGAYTEAEVIDTEVLQKYGYRFEQSQNPFLMTVEECYLEGKRSLRRMKEESKTIGFATYGKPLLEVEDVVTVNGEKYRVTQKDMEFTPPQIEESYVLRGVIEPSLYDAVNYDEAFYE